MNINEEMKLNKWAQDMAEQQTAVYHKLNGVK